MRFYQLARHAATGVLRNAALGVLRTLRLRWAVGSAAAVSVAAGLAAVVALLRAEAALSDAGDALASAVAWGVARQCEQAIVSRRSDALDDCLEALWEQEEVTEVEVRTSDDRRLTSRRFRQPMPSDRRVLYSVPGPSGASSALIRVTLSGQSIEHARALGRRDALVSCGLFVLLGIVASTIATGRLVRPLRRLAAAEVRIAEGDLSVRLPEESAMELRDLARSFNVMVEAIRDRDLALERRAGDLAGSLDALRKLQEARRQLTTMVVHDLRDPLAAAVLAIEAVDKESLSAGDRDLLEGAARRGHALRDRIQDMLDLASLQEGRLPVHKSTGCLVRVVRGVLDDLAPLAAEREQPLRCTAPDALPVALDSALVARAVANLVSNALRYSPTGAGVDVCVERRDDRAFVHVDDSGPGVPPEHREHIFEPFARLDQARAGMGLGLTFSALVAREHGGMLEATDAPSRGARFTLTLPAA